MWQPSTAHRGSMLAQAVAWLSQLPPDRKLLLLLCVYGASAAPLLFWMTWRVFTRPAAKVCWSFSVQCLVCRRTELMALCSQTNTSCSAYLPLLVCKKHLVVPCGHRDFCIWTLARCQALSSGGLACRALEAGWLLLPLLRLVLQLRARASPALTLQCWRKLYATGVQCFPGTSQERRSTGVSPPSCA